VRGRVAAEHARQEGQKGRLRERLRRVVGDVPDLDARAELGPALILFRTLVLGRVPNRAELRDEILPLMLAGS